MGHSAGLTGNSCVMDEPTCYKCRSIPVNKLDNYQVYPDKQGSAAAQPCGPQQEQQGTGTVGQQIPDIEGGANQDPRPALIGQPEVAYQIGALGQFDTQRKQPDADHRCAMSDDKKAA